MLRIKRKTEPKEKKEEVIEGQIVEEKPVETKIVKIMPDYDQLMNLSDTFAKSGMFPSITNKYEAAAVIECGRMLNMYPIASLQTITPVKGKLCIESKVLYALALNDGVKVKFIRKDSKGCTLEFSKKGRDPYTCSFLEEDAKRAGLSGKTSFMGYPEEMYFNRCISKGLRAFDPRPGLGMTTKEEAEDFPDSPLATGPVTEKPEEPKEEKVQIQFTKSKDQPVPEPEKEEPPAEPETEEPNQEEIEEKEKVAESIKSNLKEAKVDLKLFKKFLGEELQPRKPDREFVGVKFGHWSLTEGSLKDITSLDKNIEMAIEEYHKSKTFEEEAKKEEPS